MKTLTIGILLLLIGVTGTLYIQQVEKHAFQRGKNEAYTEAREAYHAEISRERRAGMELGRRQAQAEFEQQCREEKVVLEAAAHKRGKAEGAKEARREADSIIEATHRHYQQELDEQQARWNQLLSDSISHISNCLRDHYRTQPGSTQALPVPEGGGHSGLAALSGFSRRPALGILKQVFFVLVIAFLVSGFGAFLMGIARSRRSRY